MNGAGISNHLIVNSDLIIGFQTTALIEAQLTDKPIIYTGWTETEKKLRDELIPLHNFKGVETVYSAEELYTCIQSWQDGKNIGGDRAARKEVTDQYLRADGFSTKRIHDLILDK